MTLPRVRSRLTVIAPPRAIFTATETPAATAAEINALQISVDEVHGRASSPIGALMTVGEAGRRKLTLTQLQSRSVPEVFAPEDLFVFASLGVLALLGAFARRLVP